MRNFPKSLSRFAFLRISLLFMGVFGGMPAALAESAVKGVLWRIERAGLEPSYLLGTVHSDDHRVLALPAPVSQALQGSQIFCMEVLLTTEVVQVMQQRMFLPESQSLPQLLSTSLWEQVRTHLMNRGVPEALAVRLKPWAVFMTLSVPPQTGQPLDLVLWGRAQQSGLQTCGLETLDEQLAVFEDLPLARQVYLVEEVVKEAARLPAMFEALIQAYLARDLQALLRISTEDMALGDAAFNRELLTRLLDQRNHRMLERALPQLTRGKVFIAVGALHLPGEQGLLNLLAARGFRLTPVY